MATISWDDMTDSAQQRLRRVPEHLARRRIRVYGIGNPKSGTTTIPAMFDGYRAAHEVDARRFVPVATAVLRGSLVPDSPTARRALRRRSLRYNLEVDGANFLTPFAGTLSSMYPDARFVLTIRDCFSWLASRLDRMVNYPPAQDQPWFRDYLEARYDVVPDDFAPEEAPLREARLRPLASYLRQWNTTNLQALTGVPPERLLILRTEDLGDSKDQLAAFVGVPARTLSRAHANPTPTRHNILAQLPRAFVVSRVDQYCGPLMTRFWGDKWRDLESENV